ncbi:MAG TPA: phospholipase domain-containing protein [Galbitalea sp.]
MSGQLTDIRHLVVLGAEQSHVAEPAALTALTARATECRAYHLAPMGEDAGALWQQFGAALVAAGYSFAGHPGIDRLLGDLAADSLADVTFAEVDDAGVALVLAALDSSPEVAATTLVAIATGGGVALPVVTEDGRLGDPGILLLLSPWTPAGWVSEEVFDHTSLMRFCERWTRERGREVRAEVPAWRRAVCGDLLRAIELRDSDEIGPLPEIAGRKLARPVPYFAVADIRIGEETVALRLGNIGPVATLAAPFVVDDGTTVRSLVVAGSPLDDQVHARVPITVTDGRYDVTVLGPNHFRRRFAGSFPDVGVHCTADFGRDPWFPSLTLTVWHDQNLPIFFWMERRLGERAASKAAGYGSGTLERLPGPRQTARFKEEPGANTFGWYDVAVTTNADPHWLREYSGHMPVGMRPTLGY